MLGLVQTVNADLSRDIRQVWNVGARLHPHARREPRHRARAQPRAGRPAHRGRAAVRVADRGRIVGPERRDRSACRAGRSRVSAAALSYTLAKSRDNASSIGGGGTTVAQDDQNLAAEWGLSSFDRRHQLSTNLSVELPFGPNRPWLDGSRASGRRCSATGGSRRRSRGSRGRRTRRASRAPWSDVARGTNGTLRANYDGQPISLGDADDRSVLQHQRVLACRRPARSAPPRAT